MWIANLKDFANILIAPRAPRTWVLNIRRSKVYSQMQSWLDLQVAKAEEMVEVAQVGGAIWWVDEIPPESLDELPVDLASVDSTWHLFFCYSASVDPGTIQQFFAKSPHIPFILSITKPWPKGNKNTIRPCCTWMEVGRPAIRWSSGRYGIHKVWIEAMKMWCLFVSGSDLFLKMETLLCHCI